MYYDFNAGSESGGSDFSGSGYEFSAYNSPYEFSGTDSTISVDAGLYQCFETDSDLHDEGEEAARTLVRVYADPFEACLIF